MRRPFAASASPAVGVLFSAAQATTHAPQPVQRSMSMTIAHWCFIVPGLPSEDVLVFPLSLHVDGAHEGPRDLRPGEGDARGLPRGTLRARVLAGREQGERVS